VSRRDIAGEFANTTDEAHYLLGGMSAGFLLGFAVALYVVERVLLSPERGPETERRGDTDGRRDP